MSTYSPTRPRRGLARLLPGGRDAALTEVERSDQRLLTRKAKIQGDSEAIESNANQIALINGAFPESPLLGAALLLLNSGLLTGPHLAGEWQSNDRKHRAPVTRAVAKGMLARTALLQGLNLLTGNMLATYAVAAAMMARMGHRHAVDEAAENGEVATKSDIRRNIAEKVVIGGASMGVGQLGGSLVNSLTKGTWLAQAEPVLSTVREHTGSPLGITLLAAAAGAVWLARKKVHELRTRRARVRSRADRMAAVANRYNPPELEPDAGRRNRPLRRRLRHAIRGAAVAIAGGLATLAAVVPERLRALWDGANTWITQTAPNAIAQHFEAAMTTPAVEQVLSDPLVTGSGGLVVGAAAAGAIMARKMRKS